MNTEHGGEDIKTFTKGSNTDIEKELLGAKDSGQYIKSRNARNNSVDGNVGGLEKIKGEDEVYNNLALSPDYVCIGSARVNEYNIEFWTSDQPNQKDSIRINGFVMVQHDDLEFEVDKFLQVDTNEKCEGGEIFITDNNTVPLIFNVGDIVENYNLSSTKYFADFNRKIYEINLSSPVDKPVFVRLKNVGGGGGLPVGEYSYAIRYTTLAGDRTNVSPFTPLIPVVRSLNKNSKQYPSIKTYGDVPSLDQKTSYAVELRFRITNLFNYDSIEVIRYSWNAGVAIGFTPSAEIVGRVDISGTKIGVFTFIDPVDSNLTEVIPADQLTNQLNYIAKCKTLRYFDKRLVLMNYHTESREFAPTFTDSISGNKMFPIMHKMGKHGHSDPYNHTYRKSYMSKEKYGFAIAAFDGVSGKSFAAPITGFENYMFPNRRDELAAGSDSELYSTGAVIAANTDGTVTKTFEVFDHEDAIAKTDVCNFKGIFDPPDLAGTGVLTAGGKSDVGDAGEDDCPVVAPATDPDPTDYGGYQDITGVGNYYSPYSVYHPKESSDPKVDGHNFNVNTYVKDNGTEKPYAPKIFSLNYYSKGICLNGVENIPDWVKAFTVVRTRRANRVICQGLAMYSLVEGRGYGGISITARMQKEKDKLWFFSPDIESGMAAETALVGLQQNPSEYKIEFISPLGFCSELYSFDEEEFPGAIEKDRAHDLITYARLLKDGTLVGLDNNPGELIIGNAGYVAYNGYRNTVTDTVNGDFFSGVDGGNTLADIVSFEQKVEGRNSFWEIQLGADIYNHSGANGQTDFSDKEVKEWTEPFYIVNIVQEGVEIADQNINSYMDTGAFIKMESIIGEGDSTVTNPAYELVDERWEDCIPDLTISGSFASEDRFVYIRQVNGVVNTDLAWLNVTYKTPLQIAAIHADITNNGFYLTAGGVEVYGMYTHVINSENDYNIVFNVVNYNTIPTGLLIVTKYDKNAPIRIFGGDTTVGETIFAPIDKEISVSQLAATFPINSKEARGYSFGVPFPHGQYFITPRHYQIRNPDGDIDSIQNSHSLGNRVYGNLFYLRQLCVMFTCESRTATHFAFETDSNRFFPATHYVMRPLQFDKDKFTQGAEEVYDDNNINPEYFDDYGDEYLLWGYGGLRFKQAYNIDYSQEPLLDFVSKPKFGFEEVTEFCTGIIWSLPRAINQQDSPGLKSFQSLNTLILEDAQGGIQQAFDAYTSKGSNLYAICERGVCLLLHKKAILSETNGDDLGLFKGNNFIQQDLWLDRNIGITKELWRASIEGSFGTKIPPTTVSTIEGVVTRNEVLVFCNDLSIYKLEENSIVDIGRDNYYVEISKIMKNTLDGQANIVASYYDELHNEILMQFEYDNPVNQGVGDFVSKAVVYSFDTDAWISEYDFRFDKYLQDRDKVYGMRNGSTYELGVGYEINGNPIIFEVEQASSPMPQKEKEYIKININSDKKPTRVEFKDISGTLLCALDNGIQGANYLKKYDGYVQQIPRKDVGVSATRNRIQERVMIYKIIHNLEESFTLKTVFINLKPIK